MMWQYLNDRNKTQRKLHIYYSENHRVINVHISKSLRLQQTQHSYSYVVKAAFKFEL